MNIAMWSGPRNLSTAMMRSFANRSDVQHVMDEPLYASYLNRTKKNHAMYDEVIASQDIDYSIVTQACANITQGICFQKHMVQHLDFDRENDWILDLNNFFLIRKPELVVPSFLLKFPEGDFDDLGFKQQIDIFNYIKHQTKKIPVVIDATDIRNDATNFLSKLCEKLAIEWDDSMLTWKPGLKEYDGVWAKHWYHSVEKSNSFKPEETSKATLSNRAKQLVEQANIYYQQIFKYKI